MNNSTKIDGGIGLLVNLMGNLWNLILRVARIIIAKEKDIIICNFKQKGVFLRYAFSLFIFYVGYKYGMSFLLQIQEIVLGCFNKIGN